MFKKKISKQHMAIAEKLWEQHSKNEIPRYSMLKVETEEESLEIEFLMGP